MAAKWADPVVIAWRDVVHGDRWPVWPALLPRHTLAIADHRGHGGSARATTDLVRDYLADAALLVEQLPARLRSGATPRLVGRGGSGGDDTPAGPCRHSGRPAFACVPGKRERYALRSDLSRDAESCNRVQRGCGGPTTFPPSPRIAETGADWKQLAAIPLADGGTLGQTRRRGLSAVERRDAP
jgi:hypothetical protein